jgi:phage shock protein PspC (stress-responsive transcriptional regulator)
MAARSCDDETGDMSQIKTSFAQQGLIRPREGRVLGGVCAGLGRRFGLGPWPARFLFIIILMLLPGSQFIIYPVLWILMPSEDDQSVWQYHTDQPQPPQH